MGARMKKLTSLYLCIAYFSQQCNTFLFETCIFLCFKGVFKSNSPIWHKKRPFLAKKQLKNEKTPKKLDVFSSGSPCWVSEPKRSMTVWAKRSPGSKEPQERVYRATHGDYATGRERTSRFASETTDSRRRGTEDPECGFSER